MSRSIVLAVLLAGSSCTIPNAEKTIFDVCGGDQGSGQVKQGPGLGKPSDYPLTADSNIGSVAVGAPLQCSGNQGHIRLERKQGKRTLGISAGESAGCFELPKQAQDFSQCPVIAASAILHEVFGQLRARGIVVNGIGRSPCFGHAGRQDISEITAGVVGWKDAHEAVKLTAQLLEVYDIRGRLGVAVRGVYCLKDNPTSPGQAAAPPKTCKSSISSPKSQAEDADKKFSPSVAEVSPGTAKVRFHYAASAAAKPVFVEMPATVALISPSDPDRSGSWDWFVQVNVSIPQFPHPFAFSVAFPRISASQTALRSGDFSANDFSMGIPKIEHGDSCRMGGAAKPSTIHIVESNGDWATGYWRGNVLLEPAFFAPDAKPTGEKFTLESIVFNRIEARKGGASTPG